MNADSVAPVLHDYEAHRFCDYDTPTQEFSMFHHARIRLIFVFVIAWLPALARISVAQTKPSTRPNHAADAEIPTTPTDQPGRKLIQFVIEKHGGADKIDGIKAYRTTTHMTDLAKPQGMTVVMTVQLPDTLKSVTTSGSNRVVAVYSPSGSFASANGQPVQRIPDADHQFGPTVTHFSTIYILQHPDSPELQFHDGGTKLIGAIPYRILDIAGPDGRTAQWFVDAMSGRILRAVTTFKTGQMIHHTTVDYTGWETIDGVELPTSSTSTTDGGPPRDAATKYELNPVLAADEFSIPPANAEAGPASRP
jgi:hypothetical protein